MDIYALAEKWKLTDQEVSLLDLFPLAIRANKAALLVTISRKTGERVVLLVLKRVEGDVEQYIPIAKLLDPADAMREYVPLLETNDDTVQEILRQTEVSNVLVVSSRLN